MKVYNWKVIQLPWLFGSSSEYTSLKHKSSFVILEKLLAVFVRRSFVCLFVGFLDDWLERWKYAKCRLNSKMAKIKRMRKKNTIIKMPVSRCKCLACECILFFLYIFLLFSFWLLWIDIIIGLLDSFQWDTNSEQKKMGNEIKIRKMKTRSFCVFGKIKKMLFSAGKKQNAMQFNFSAPDGIQRFVYLYIFYFI